MERTDSQSEMNDDPFKDAINGALLKDTAVRTVEATTAFCVAVKTFEGMAKNFGYDDDTQQKALNALCAGILERYGVGR